MNKYLALILTLLIISNCTIKQSVEHHGVHMLETKNTKLKVNIDNKNDIIKILGAPSTKSILEDDLWIYIENKKTNSSMIKLGKKKELTNNVLVLQIDKKGLLKSKNFYNIDDQNMIKFSNRQTEISDKEGFIYGVLSSFRQKVNS